MKNALLSLLILFNLHIFAQQVEISNGAVSLGGVKEFNLNGTNTQWNDVVTPAIQTKVNPATALPAFDYDSLALLLVRDADSSEIAYYQIQLPHGVTYKTTAICSPHFHYTQYAAADTTFEAVLWYRISKIGNGIGAWTRLTTVDRAALTLSGSWGHQICEFKDLPLNNVSESSIIDFKLFRKDNAGNPATLYMKMFDVHFEFEKLGTTTEYPTH